MCVENQLNRHEGKVQEAADREKIAYASPKTFKNNL
jgi:hypothetical protein